MMLLSKILAVVGPEWPTIAQNRLPRCGIKARDRIEVLENIFVMRLRGAASLPHVFCQHVQRLLFAGPESSHSFSIGHDDPLHRLMRSPIKVRAHGQKI